MAPTLPTACGSLPPEGALRLRPGEAGPAAPAGKGWRRRARHCLWFAALAGLSSMAHAQSVALAGMLGSKALLVVNGAAPKSVAAGETHLDVKVISTSGEQAVLEINGKRHTLRVGDAPVSVGSGGASGRGAGQSNKIVLTAGTGGHFMTQGQINGKTVQFMVDTGATAVSMTADEAERLGVDYKSGQRIQLSTANGVVAGWRTTLNSVRVGDVEIFNVAAIVAARDMPFLLLGNSFLTRFQMIRENDQMTLTKRF